MSAFIVSNNHLNALVALALRGTSDMAIPSSQWRDYGRGLFSVVYPQQSDLNAFGAALLLENLRSVAERYPHQAEPDAALQVEAGQYRFRDPGAASRLTSVAALKLLACFDYQACEHRGWLTSEARKATQQLRSMLVSSLPGYDAAPWAI